MRARGSTVPQPADLHFENGRAEYQLTDVQADEHVRGGGKFGGKRVTQYALHDVNVGPSTIQSTLSVTFSALNKGHNDERCTPCADTIGVRRLTT